MAGRKRSKENQWMPARVYKGRSAYEWRPLIGGTYPLCSLDAKQSEVWKAYEQAIKDFENHTTVEGLINRFFVSADFAELAPSTQKDYRKYAKKIIPVFGKMTPDRLNLLTSGGTWTFAE